MCLERREKKKKHSKLGNRNSSGYFHGNDGTDVKLQGSCKSNTKSSFPGSMFCFSVHIIPLNSNVELFVVAIFYSDDIHYIICEKWYFFQVTKSTDITKIVNNYLYRMKQFKVICHPLVLSWYSSKPRVITPASPLFLHPLVSIFFMLLCNVFSFISTPAKVFSPQSRQWAVLILILFKGQAASDATHSE